MNLKISILMCINGYNPFLDEQLKSICDQSYKKFDLIISDDGKKKLGKDYLKDYQDKIKIRYIEGPQKGFAQNFLSLIYDEKIKSDFYAFCDQDDIWFPDKLKLSLKKSLDMDYLNMPTLFCTSSILIDENKKKIGRSLVFNRKPSFANSILQNIASGNTMFFNNKLKDVFLKQINIDILSKIYSHDWLLYQIATLFDGKVVYDDYPSVFYRQHRNNLIGYKKDLKTYLLKINSLFKNEYYNLHQKHYEILLQVAKKNKIKNEDLINFKKIRSGFILNRLYYFAKSNIRKLTLIQNLFLFISIIFKKI